MLLKIYVHNNYQAVSTAEQFLDLGNQNLEYEMDFVTGTILGANFIARAVFSCKEPSEAFVRFLKRLICDDKTQNIDDVVENFLKGCRHQPTQYSQYTLQVKDCTEILLCTLLHYRYFFKHKNQLVWVLCDLPPGVGKSTEIGHLWSILGNMHITTPTAKAAKVFPENITAKTLHSRFGLPAKTGDYKNSGKVLQTHIDKYTNTTAQSDPVDFFVFDEFSMYDYSYILAIFKMLRQSNKFGLVCGDSCQMPPVRSVSMSIKNILQQANLKFCECKPLIEYNSEGAIDCELSIQIKRLRHDCLDESGCRECMTRKLHYEFILFLRKRIFASIEAKPKTNKKLNYVLTAQALNYVLRFFGNMTVDQKLTLDDVLKIVISTQQRVLAGDYRSLKSTPCVLAFENKVNMSVFDQVKKECNFDTRENSVDAAMMLPNIYVTEEAWNEHGSVLFRNIQDDLPEFVGSVDFYKGMFIKCRKNDSGSRTYNSQTAIFLGFSCNNAIVSTKKVPALTPCAKFYKIGFTSEPKKIKMHIFDLATSTERRVSPSLKFCCEHCRQKTCAIHLRAPCCYYIFNWSVNYSSTIFALQGVTISAEKMYILPELVFGNNILRTAYIIFSRVNSPSQLIISPGIIFKLVQYIFGCTESALKRFCDAQKISIAC